MLIARSDADRQCLQTQLTPRHLETVDSAFYAEQAVQRHTEMLKMQVRVKRDETRTQQPGEQFLSAGQDREDVRATLAAAGNGRALPMPVRVLPSRTLWQEQPS
jgi:hypothetical protein